MNSTNPETNHEVFRADPPVFLLKRLTVRALEPHEYDRVGGQLDGQQTIALRLYATTNLQNATATCDALNHNQPQAHAVLKAGGDYFFQLKNEHRHAYQAALKRAKTPPFCPHPRTRHPPQCHGNDLSRRR